MTSPFKDVETPASDEHKIPKSADDMNAISRFFFRWVDPVLKVMNTRPLESSDIPRVVRGQDSEIVTNRLYS